MSLQAELALLDGPSTAVVEGVALTRTGRPRGEAPTLVLVHGVGAARLVWAPPRTVELVDAMVRSAGAAV